MFSRDLIDLAMQAGDRPLDPAGIAKARRAYGDSVLGDLEQARTRLLERGGRLATCMARLQMHVAEPALRAKIRCRAAAPE